MRVAVINCSAPIYNLAVDKIANYHRHQGDEVYCGRWSPLDLSRNFDKFYFSAIFTWHIPRLVSQANMARSWGKPVEIGGPAATFLGNFIEKRTGIHVHRGLDERFEQVPGKYRVTFTSRGCPHGCKFCGVRRVEPDFIEYDDFGLSHVVQDNNILATSWDHQKLVVDRFRKFKGELDFNSGFDIRFFTEDHWNLYAPLELHLPHRGRHWRFAFDSMDVENDVRRVSTMLKNHGLDRHQVSFYCLIGFPGQTPEECLYRLQLISRGFGMNAYPMRYWPLNSLVRKYVAPGFSHEILQAMTVFYQTPHIWKSHNWDDFWRDYRKKKPKVISEKQAVLV